MCHKISSKVHLKAKVFEISFFIFSILHFRYLNNRMISYDEAFHVEPLMSPDLGGLGLQWPIGTILEVRKTNSLFHDGNYTCAPSTLTPDSVVVHIIDEGKIPPAAVYGDSSKGFKLVSSSNFPLIFSPLLLLLMNYRFL